MPIFRVKSVKIYIGQKKFYTNMFVGFVANNRYGTDSISITLSSQRTWWMNFCSPNPSPFSYSSLQSPRTSFTTSSTASLDFSLLSQSLCPFPSLTFDITHSVIHHHHHHHYHHQSQLPVQVGLTFWYLYLLQ